MQEDKMAEQVIWRIRPGSVNLAHPGDDGIYERIDYVPARVVYEVLGANSEFPRDFPPLVLPPHPTREAANQEIRRLLAAQEMRGQSNWQYAVRAVDAESYRIFEQAETA
jgi:hypothetical protein